LNGGIDRILLGDNPFIGVDHLSQERSRSKGLGFDTRRIAKVIDTALASGADGLLCSAHPIMRSTLSQMRERNYFEKFEVHIIVPDAQGYVRMASEKGVIGFLTDTLGGLSWRKKANVIIEGGLSAITFNPAKAIQTYLYTEHSSFSKLLPKNAKLESILLHELMTELIVSFGMKELARNYIDFVEHTLGATPGFVTRNFARFVDFALEAELPLRDVTILTPFNAAGFQMNPSRAACENALRRIQSADVIAMSLLAGGYLSLEAAHAYIGELARPVSCVVGASTEEHAKQTFSAIKSWTAERN